MEFLIAKYRLSPVSFYDLLSPSDVSYVKENSLRREYKKGQIFFKEKNYSKGIYILRKGKVKIYQTNEEGKQNIVYIHKKGEFFGHRPLLSDEPYPISAAAMNNAVVSFIPKEVFLNLLETSHGLPRKLLVTMAKEFTVWINKMTVFSQYSVKERVAISLLVLGKVYENEKKPGAKTIISIHRDDFAGFVGTARESLVRMLRIFKDEKIISARGTKITVLKPEALMNGLRGI